MSRPACVCQSCDQGRKPCPCPVACQVAERGEPTHGLLVSPYFWSAGVLCLACWAVLAWVAYA